MNAIEARDAIVELLRGIDGFEQARVTLYVRTPDPKNDILIFNDHPDRLKQAIDRRMAGQPLPAEEKGPLL